MRFATALFLAALAGRQGHDQRPIQRRARSVRGGGRRRVGLEAEVGDGGFRSPRSDRSASPHQPFHTVSLGVETPEWSSGWWKCSATWLRSVTLAQTRCAARCLRRWAARYLNTRSPVVIARSVGKKCRNTAFTPQRSGSTSRTPSPPHRRLRALFRPPASHLPREFLASCATPTTLSSSSRRSRTPLAWRESWPSGSPGLVCDSIPTRRG